MSLSRGVAALYLSQAYGIAVSLAVTPLLLRVLGPEGYGLVGVYLLMQAWFHAMDLGAPALLTRQVARWRAGVLAPEDLWSSVKVLEVVFLAAGALALAVLVAASGPIAQRWLNVRQLPHAAVAEAFALMAAACFMRWMTGPHRGVLMGAEKIAWLAAVNAGFVSLRFVAVLPLVYWSAQPIRTFFALQWVLGALEFALMRRQARVGRPAGLGTALGRGWQQLSSAEGLGWAMAQTTLLWLLVSQSDRIVLSSLLALSDYGYFTLAASVAAAVFMVTTPVVQAAAPRLAFLVAADDQGAGARSIYRRASCVVAAIASSFGCVLAAISEPVVRAWTGDAVAARAVAPVLSAYAIAQALLAIGMLPYQLQLARGDLRLHVRGSALTLLLLLPMIVVAGSRWGAAGAGWAWVAVAALNLLLWVPLVHRRFVPGLHLQWLLRDVLAPALPAALVAGAGAMTVVWWPQGRWATAVCCAALLGACLLATYWSVQELRAAAAGAWRAWWPARVGAAAPGPDGP
jgi:O-antigen/teichoic acid export membrane protein